MKIRKAFKYRLNMNKKQQAKMKNFAESCCFVCNKALAEQKEPLKSGKSCMSYSKMAGELVNWKQQENTAFLMDLNQALLKAFDKTNSKQFLFSRSTRAKNAQTVGKISANNRKNQAEFCCISCRDKEKMPI